MSDLFPGAGSTQSAIAGCGVSSSICQCGTRCGNGSFGWRCRCHCTDNQGRRPLDATHSPAAIRPASRGPQDGKTFNGCSSDDADFSLEAIESVRIIGQGGSPPNWSTDFAYGEQLTVTADGIFS